MWHNTRCTLTKLCFQSLPRLRPDVSSLLSLERQGKIAYPSAIDGHHQAHLHGDIPQPRRSKRDQRAAEARVPSDGDGKPPLGVL